MLFPTFATASEATSTSTPKMFATRLFGSPVSTSVIPEEKMPLDPMDSLWMAKAPQVSDLVVQPNVTFKAVTGGSAGPAQSSSPIPIGGGANDGIRPDFDTDVLWKPPSRRTALKERTISTESTDSEIGGRKMSSIEIGTSAPMTSPMEAQPRTRRMSISEMLFGSSPNSFSWGMSTPTNSQNELGDRKMSITEDPRFKDFMKHQSKILGDDGISGGFKRSNYMKD